VSITIQQKRRVGLSAIAEVSCYVCRLIQTPWYRLFRWVGALWLGALGNVHLRVCFILCVLTGSAGRSHR